MHFVTHISLSEHLMEREVRRHAASGVTRRKQIEIEEIARRWHQARALYVTSLWSPQLAQQVLQRPRLLRERQRAVGWVRIKLTSHYHQTAFLSAAAVVAGQWRSALVRTRLRVARLANLSDPERHWMYFVLKSPPLVQSCLDGRSIVLKQSWSSGLEEQRLARKLRRILLRTRGRSPRPARRTWFEVDTTLYRTFIRTDDRFFRGAWIALSGLDAGKRICLPLAGRTTEGLEPRPGRSTRPSLRVEVAKVVSFHTLQRVPCRNRPLGAAAGLDKGYDVLLTLSTGDPTSPHTYGDGIGVVADRLRRDAEGRIKRRRALAAHERSLRSTDPARAARIRRHSLGTARLRRRGEGVRRALRDDVNRALNALFRENPHLSHLAAEALTFRGHGRRPRGLLARVGRWLKGYLQRRLEYKAELNGVELKVVNAAYTSQTCPRCWFTSALNRHGPRFQCRDCAFTGSADAVAATNVLRRASDPAITRFTPPACVKQTLDARWRSARIGRAWGSNEGASADDVWRDPQPRTEPRTTALDESGPSLRGSNTSHEFDTIELSGARSSAG